jgi:hypothetical protein
LVLAKRERIPSRYIFSKGEPTGNASGEFDT